MAMGNEIVGRPGVDPTQGGSNNQQQQLRPMTPVEQTVSLLGAPNEVTDKGIPVYDYSSLTSKYDDDYLSWLKVKAMNGGSDISFTIPNKDEFIASQFKQNNVDPSIDKMPLVMNGEEVKDLQGNSVMVKNPQIESVYNNASKQYDEMYNSIVNFSEKTFKMLNNEEHFNQLNSIFTKDLGGDKFIRNQAAEKGTGQITFSKKEYTGLTPEEEAAEKGYIFNAETGQFEDYGFWDAVKRRTLNTIQLASSLNPINTIWSSVANTAEAITGFEGVHVAKWLMGGYASSRGFEAILPESSMLTVDYDSEQDSYYLTKRNVTDRSVTSGQIYGVFGKGSNDNFFGAMAGGFYNMVNPTIMAARFSSLTSQLSMDAMDLFLDDQDKNFYSNEYAKSIAAQNYAVSASYTPSVNASENMFSLEAWGGHIGNALGILTMMGLTKGANSLTAGSSIIQNLTKSSNFLLRAGGKVAKYAPTTGLISVSETSSLNQEFNDNGVSRELAVGILPAYYGLTMAIESIGANIMLQETKLGSKVFVKEILNNSIGVNKSSSAGRFMRNVWLGRPENWIQGYATEMVENMSEEGLQQITENVFKAASDYAMMNETFRDRTEQKYLYENGLLPVGEVTTFFDANANDSYFDILKENLWKGVGDAAIIGAVTSVPMSMARSVTGIVKKQSPSMYYDNTRQKTIQNAVINGQDEDLYKEATEMYYRGRLGSTVLDVEGKPRPSDKEQAANWMSENDFLYQQILGEIEIARTIKNSIPESQLNLLDNNMTLVSDFMALKGRMNKINTEINSLMIQEEQEGVDNKETIGKLQQDLKDLQQDYTDYTTVEPGSQYSKKYNDVLFDIKLRYVYARSLASEMYAKKTNKNITDLTQKDYASSLYSTMFMHAKNSSDRLVADMSVTATRNSEALIESHKKSINEMYAKKSESAVTDMEGLLSELTGIEMGSYDNMDDKVNAIISSMSKIDAIRSNYGVVQKASESTAQGEVSDQTKFDNIFKKVQESIGKLNQSLGELAPRDLTGQEDIVDIGEDDNLISPKAPKVERVMRMEDNQEDLAYQKRQSISAASDFYTSEDFSLMDDTDTKVEELSLEHQARYFNSMDYLLNDAEEKSRAGVNNSGLDVDTFIANVDAMRRKVNLSHKMAMYDHYANEEFFKDSGASKYKRDVDYTLSREDLEKVGVKTSEYNNRINNILQKVYGEKGVGDHNIISSLHARVQVNFYRDMYTKGMQIDEKPVNDAGTISGFLKINLGNEKFNTFKNLLMAVVRQEQAGEKKKGRFDYTKKDIISPVYVENGNKKGILSDEGLRLTEELQSKIFQLEDFIKANKDVFFSEEALYLQISTLNGVMHGFEGETFLNVDKPQTVLRQAVATQVGYINSSFENIKHGINSIDLLKASAIIDNMSGEGSLIKNHGDMHGAVELPGKIMDDGTRYVDAESVNSFNYKWAVNYLTFLAGSDTHSMYKDQLARLEYSKENAQHVPTTFEQMLAVGQGGSFFNGGNKVLNDILNAEKKYFINRHTELGAQLKERNRDSEIEPESHIIGAVESSRYRYVENHFMITGDLAAGKTEILKYTLDAALKNDIENGNVSITIVANTNDLYLKNKKLVESYFADKHPTVKLEVNQEFIDTRDIVANKDKLSSFVIIDESGLMGDKFFNNGQGADLRDIFKVGGRRLLTIGDEFQVTDITRNDVAASTKAGMVSIPLTERFRSGLAITNTLADFFRSMIAQKKNSFADMAIDDLKMPNVFHKVNENGTKLGVEYNSSPRDVVNNFVSDDANVSKVLIIPNTEYLARPEFEQIRVRKGDGTYDVDPKYKNNVRIIVDNLYEPAQSISSIQGLEAEHVYIAFDYIDLIKNYISAESNWKVAPKSMYTAVGRVADKGNNANYVNCIGNPKAKASENVLTKLEKNKGRNIENEIVLLQNIVGKQTRIVKDQQPATTTDTIDSDTYDIFIEDGYYYTGKSTDNKKLYYASKPKGSLFTNRITYENGKITERITEYEIEALQNGKPTTKYVVRFTYGLDDNGNQGQLKSGNIYEITTSKDGYDKYKSIGEFENLKQVIETLNGKNNTNKKTQEVFGKNKDLKQAKFRVNNLFIKESLWKNVVTGNAHIAVIDYLKQNKNVKVVVYHETPVDGKAMITNEGDKLYLSYMDMFKEVKEEITYDEATAYVNGTFMRKEEDLFQGNLIIGAVQEPMSQIVTESQNPILENTQVYEETNMLNLGDYAAVIGEAIEIDNKEYLITGIQAPTNAESNMHLITVTDANGDSMTITSQQFKNYSNAVKSNNAELGVPNEERKEQKKANRTRTEMVNSGKMSLPVYFYGRAIADSPSMRNIPEADRMAVSYLIQNIKQKLVRLSYGYSNKAVYVKKGHSYLSDENGFVSDGNMVIVLKGQVNTNIDTIAKELNQTELYNQYKDTVMESLETISVSEPLGLENINVGNSDYIKEQYQQKFNEEGDASASVFSTFLDKYYNVIKEYNDSDNQEPLMLGNVNTVLVNKNHALDINQTGNTIVTKNGPAFINDMKARGFTIVKIITDHTVGMKQFKNKLAYVFKSAYGTVSTVFATPKYIKNVEGFVPNMIEELKTIRKKKGSDRISALNQSKLFQMVMQNWSEIKNNSTFWSNHLELTTNNGLPRININKNAFLTDENGKKRKIEEAESLAIDNIIKVISEQKIISDMGGLRVPIIYERAANNSIEVDANLVDFNAQGINATGMYVDFNTLAFSDNATTTNKEVDPDDPDQMMINYQNGKAMTKSTADNGSQMHIEEGKAYIRRVLGNVDQILEVVGENTIFTDEGAAYGLYQLGKIKAEASNEGYMNPYVLRHETGHFVLANMNPQKRARTLLAGRVEMVRTESFSEEQVMSMDDNQVEEWIVTQYQYYGTDKYTYGYSSNITFAAKVLNKFKAFVNKIFSDVFSDTYLTDLFNSIENGDFNGMNVIDTKADPMFMPKEEGDTIDMDQDVNEVNKESKELIDKREAFMQDVNYSSRIKSDIIDFVRTSIANDSYVNPNGSKTLEQAASDFVTKQKKYDLSERDITINGKVIKRKDITPDMVTSATGDNLTLIKSYLANKHVDYIIGELYGNKNAVNAWMHYNETSESRDITSTMSGMFDFVLSIIKTENGKTVDPNTVKMLIKDNATEITKRANSGTNVSIIDAMIADFNSKASQDMKSVEYRDNLKAIASFVSQHKNIIESMRDGSMAFDYDRYMASASILNKLGSTIISTWNKNGNEYYYENGELKVKRLTSNRLSRIVNDIRNRVASATMSGQLVSDKLFNALKGSNEETKFNNKTIGKSVDVSDNGVYTVIGMDNVKLIEKITLPSGKNVFQFTQEGRTTYINNSKKLFTLLGISKKESYKLNKYVTRTNNEFDVLQDKIANYNNEQREAQIMAEGIYYMIASANQWANYKQALYELSLIESDIDNYDERKAELDAKLEKGEFAGATNLKQDIDAFFVKLKSNVVEMDSSKESVDQNVIAEEAADTDAQNHVNFYKPSDFYQFFDIVADLEVSDDSRGASAVLYDNLGNRIPAYGISNMLTEIANTGMVKNEMVEGKLYKNVDGNMVAAHPLLNQTIGFVVRNFEKVFSYSDKSATKKPKISDRVRVGVDNFVKGMIESAGKTIKMSVFDMSTREDEYSYDLVSNKPLFTFSKVGEAFKVFFHKDMIASKFENSLKYYFNAAHDSAKKLNTILAKYGHGKLVDSYFSGSFNSKGKEYQNMVSELNMVLRKSAGPDTKLRRDILANLIKDIDYSIDKDGVISVGRAISFNSHSLWNYNMYEKIVKAKDADAKFNVILDNIKDAYISFTKTLSKSGYRLNENYKKPIGYNYEGNHHYYEEKNSGIEAYNPIMLSFFLADISHRTFLDALTVGDFNLFGTDGKKAKRKAITSSSSLKSYVEKGKLNITRFNVMLVDSNRESITVNGEKLNPLSNDGFSRGTLVGKFITELALGGQFSGEDGQAKKTLLVDQDIATGTVKSIKHAVEFASNESYNNSDVVRAMERLVMLDWGDNVNKEFASRGIDNGFNPYDVFITSLKNNKKLGAENAMKRVIEHIITNYNETEVQIIFDNAILQVSDISTAKNEITGFAPYAVNNATDIDAIEDAYTEIDENDNAWLTLPKMSFSVEGSRFVTNLTQDATNLEENVAAPHQLLSITAQLDYDGKNFSGTIDNAIGKIRESKASKLAEKMNGTDSANKFMAPSGKSKVMNYIREVAKKSADNVRGMSNLSNIVNDINIDLRIPLINEDVKRMFRGHVNSAVNKIKMNGLRATLLPSNDRAMYSADGGLSYYTMEDIESIFKIDMDDYLGAKEIVIGDRTFVLSRPKAMHWNENGEMQKTEGILVNPLLRQMDMLPTESLKSIYTFIFGDNKVGEKSVVDLQGKTVNEITDALLPIIMGAITGKNSGIQGFQNNIDKYDQHVYYRNNKDLLMRAVSEFDRNGEISANTEAEIKKSIKSFYSQWEKSLTYIDVRIPTGHLGQTNIGRIVAFTSTGNNAYLPGSLGVRNDTDFDGDQNQFYLYSVGDNLTEEQIQTNIILDTIIAAYSDKNNQSKIDRSSNVDDIREMIGDKDSSNPMSTYGAMVENAMKAKSGANAISVFANLISAHGEIFKSGKNNPFTNVKFKGDNNIFRNLGNWLQIALDSANNVGIGELGISNVAIPMFSMALVKFNSKINSADSLNRSVIHFFKNRRVQSILNKVEAQQGIDNYYSHNRLLTTIHNEYNEARIAADGIKKVDYDKAIKGYRDSVAKVKSLNAELGKIFKDKGLNDLWKVVNNKDLFEGLVSKSEEITSLMDSYNDDAKTQEEKDNNAEILSNFSDTLKEMFDDIDQLDEKAIKRLTTNADADIVKVAEKMLSIKEQKDELYEKINGKKEGDTKVDGYLDIIRKYNDNIVLKRMYDLAILGEQTRRYAEINSIRNDIPNKSDERYAYVTKVEMYLGMSIKDFLDGKEVNVSKFLDWNKKHNRNFQLSANEEEMKTMLKIEEDIYRSFNLVNMLRESGFSKHSSVLSSFSNEYVIAESPMIEDHPVIKEAFEHFTSYLYAMPTKLQKVVFDKTVKSYILNAYYRLKGMTISLPSYAYDTSNGFRFAENLAPSLKNLKLWVANDVQNFISNVPLVLEFYRTAASHNTVIDESGKNDPQLQEILEAFKTNKFLQAYTIDGKDNAKRMVIDGNMIMSDEKKETMRNEFAKLPEHLQSLIFHYESLRNAYTFKSGSAYDMMPKELFYDQSGYMDKIVDELDTIGKNKLSKEAFKKNFVENVIKDSDALNFKPSEDKKDEFGKETVGKITKLKSSAVVGMKVSPGDSSNKKGYSSLYYYNFNKQKLKVSSDNKRMTATSASQIFDNDYDHDKISQSVILRSFDTELVRRLADDYIEGKSVVYERTYAEKKFFDPTTIYYTSIGTPIKVEKVDDNGTTFRIFAYDGKTKAKYSNILSPNIKIKQGVSELFQSNPELANVGTKQQYSQYLDTIFPYSKIKDIVYHGVTNRTLFDKFDLSFAKYENAIFFFKNKLNAKKWTELKVSEPLLPKQLKDGINEPEFIDRIYYLFNYKSFLSKEERQFVNEQLEKYNLYWITDFIEDGKEDGKSIEQIKIELKHLFNPQKIISAVINSKNPKIIDEHYDYILKSKKGQELKHLINNARNTNDSVVLNSITEFTSKKTDAEDNYRTLNVTFMGQFGVQNDTQYSLNTDTQYAVFEPEQIHILGSKQDIEGFKEFVSNNKQNYSNVLNSPIAEQMSVRTYTNQSDVVRVIIDKFNKILPGVPVIVETKETAMQKTGRFDRKGWVDKSGFHFVKENVTADTMVHEFTELWLEHLKTNEYEKYVQLIKLAKNDMKNNPEIVAAIQQSYGLTGNALAVEYISTVSGFNSVDAVETFISQKYGPKTAKNKAGGIFNAIANFIGKFWDTIKSLFTRLSKTEESTLNSMDFTTASFRDVLNAISDDVMNERSVFSFDEGVELMNLMEDDEVHYSNVLKEVSNIDDFDNVFSRDALGINDRSNISKAEFFYGKIRENKKTGEYYIFYNNKKYNIDKGSKADILKQIESKVLPAVEYGVNQRYDALDIILKESKDEKEFTDKAYDMVEATDNKWNFASLKKIFNMSGLSLGYESVVRYSDLKYSDDPSLRMLYDEYTFGKLDPYIIIHGKGPNGKTNISIMELTSDNLLGANTNLADKNLLASFGVTDVNFFNQGGTMRNNVMGIKQFKLTLLSAHIMRTNPNVQINNVSIFGNPTQQMTKSVINNIDSALLNLKAAGTNQNVLNMISNEYIKTLLTDKKLLSQKHVGTYLEMLAQYVDPETNLGKLTTNAVNFIRDRKFNEIPRTDIINAIKNRMRIIEKMKADWSERINDKEYELLSNSLIQLDLRIKRDTIELSDGKDMIKMERWFTTYHNVKNPLAQTFVLAYRKAKTALLHTMKTNFKELNATRDAYLNTYAKQNPGAFTTSKMFEASSEVFKKLYHELNVWWTINGQRQLVKTHVPFLLHYDVNNEATKRALNNGEIDMSVIEYALKMKKSAEDEMIKKIMYDSEVNGNPISEARAKVIYLSMLNKYDTSKMYGEFIMPIIKKSSAEMMLKGIKNMATKEGWQSIGDGISKTLDEAGNDYNLFIDVSTENNANDITNEFNKQIGSFDEVMKIAGMKMNSDGSLEVIDPKAFDNISTNAEMAFATFILANTRDRIFKTMLTPIYNATRLLMMKQGINNKDKSLDNTIAWLDDAYKTLVLREAVDMEGTKAHKTLVKSIKYIQRLYSNVTLGFSTKLGVKSFGLLKLTEAVDAMAYKMANVGVPQDHIDKYTKMLDPKNLAKAEAFMIANWSFGWTLARKLQVIDSQEFDLIHNPVYTKTSQNLASDNVAHILNSGGDNATRAVMMISHLISNGSLQAYSFNKVTGEITYDETKDRKFYDENGKLKNTLLRDVVFQDNVDIGMQDPNSKKLMLGESYKDMDMVKNTTDRWVIGSMTEDARWQLNNVVWGRLFTQFRLFSDERLFKAGVFGATRQTMIGTGYEFITDEYGNEIPYVEVKQIEGALQSWGAAFKEVIEYKSMSHFATFWKESSQERRMNIMRSMIKLAVAAILFVTFKAMLPDDEEGDAYRQGLSYRHYFNFLYRDMFDLMVIGETLNDPIPMVNFVEDVYSVLFNDAEWDKLLKVSGFYRGTVGMTEDIIDVSTKSLEEIAQEERDAKNK